MPLPRAPLPRAPLPRCRTTRRQLRRTTDGRASQRAVRVDLLSCRPGASGGPGGPGGRTGRRRRRQLRRTTEPWGVSPPQRADLLSCRPGTGRDGGTWHTRRPGARKPRVRRRGQEAQPRSGGAAAARRRGRGRPREAASCTSSRTPPGRHDSESGVRAPTPVGGAPAGTRTLTEAILSRLPLPIGLRGPGRPAYENTDARHAARQRAGVTDVLGDHSEAGTVSVAAVGPAAVFFAAGLRAGALRGASAAASPPSAVPFFAVPSSSTGFAYAGPASPTG